MENMNRQQIKGKEIFIVENHQEVIEAWAEYKINTKVSPVLFTLDHHTDTHEAFLQFSANPPNYDTINRNKQSDAVQALRTLETTKIERAISNLRNDEHIDAALKSEIIEKAFILPYNSTGNKPFSQMVIVENDCAIGCRALPHNDDCTIPHYNQAIESIFLNDKLNKMMMLCPAYFTSMRFNRKYILDIDLDYFHTRESLNPNDPTIFYELIKNAEIITIAKESAWVQKWKEDFDQYLTIEYILEKLKMYIENALA